jgi:hypothetical protein
MISCRVPSPAAHGWGPHSPQPVWGWASWRKFPLVGGECSGNQALHNHFLSAKAHDKWYGLFESALRAGAQRSEQPGHPLPRLGSRWSRLPLPHLCLVTSCHHAHGTQRFRELRGDGAGWRMQPPNSVSSRGSCGRASSASYCVCSRPGRIERMYDDEFPVMCTN